MFGKKQTTKKDRKEKSKHFPSRKSAFRAFKRDYEIPKTEQPAKVVSPDSKGGIHYKLDNRNKRLYIFEEKKNKLGRTKRKEAHLREGKHAFYSSNKGNQKPHFNAGHAGSKLKDHYYFNNNK